MTRLAASFLAVLFTLYASSVSAATVQTRLFVQDSQTKQLLWTDVSRDENAWSASQPQAIEGFPKLDPEKQELVQMNRSGAWLLVGVRDDNDGEFQSGWILIDTGVREEAHGDHAHWDYSQSPHVVYSKLDEKQGNPAHLYVYGEDFFLANDRLNGYTRFDVSRLDPTEAEPQGVAFHLGGGNHITLAAVRRKVGYSSWIDGGGPNAGRIDVTELQPSGNTEIAYSFTLPSANIHGANENQSKVFFAPADGICWVDADTKLEYRKKDVPVHHIALGTDPETEKPLRTGAFVNHRHYVLFVTGEGSFAKLGLIDASRDQPAVKLLDLKMSGVNKPVTPHVVRTKSGKRFAFVFHNHAHDVKGDEFLSTIDLDPNDDVDFGDATLLKTEKIERSQVIGHYGHHDMAFSDDGAWAFFTAPGAKTISVLSLQDLKIEPLLKLEGAPTSILSHGAADIED